jgi:hypothetical protein
LKNGGLKDNTDIEAILVSTAYGGFGRLRTVDGTGDWMKQLGSVLKVVKVGTDRVWL